MRKSRWFCLVSLLICFFIASCKSQSEGNSLDLTTVLPTSAVEIAIKAEGKEVRITDSEGINEVISIISQAEFIQTNSADINAPGANSVSIDVFTESGSVTITFPCYLYESNVYSAGVDSIKLFGKYFEQ